MEDRVIPADTKIGFHNLSQSSQYYAIQLDGRTIKTLYKDDLLIPSLPLAMAVAEEWDSQIDTIDMRRMNINQMLAKGFRSINDDGYLRKFMRSELI